MFSSTEASCASPRDSFLLVGLGRGSFFFFRAEFQDHVAAPLALRISDLVLELLFFFSLCLSFDLL